LSFASIIVLTSSLASAQTAKFQIEEATIEDIPSRDPARRADIDAAGAALSGAVKAYNGTCVNQPDGVLGQAPIIPIKNAASGSMLWMTLNFEAATREN